MGVREAKEGEKERRTMRDEIVPDERPTGLSVGSQARWREEKSKEEMREVGKREKEKEREKIRERKRERAAGRQSR